jgi:glycosyltransferase involved in cell wall biosynthesis
LTRPRIRVLRVISRLNVGGPALQASLLTERLDPTRYESRLVTGVAAPDEGNYLALRGIPTDRVVTVSALRRPIRGLHDLAALGCLVTLIRRFRPHVVHTHTAKAGALGRLAARVCGVPVVVHTFHGHVFRGYFTPAVTRLFVVIERQLAPWTHRLLAVSDTVRAELLQLGIGSPPTLSVQPLGLDLEPLVACARRRGALRAELGLNGAAPLVGIVARLVAIKAHEVFVAAAARVARECPATRFVVVGDGERRGELVRAAADLGLGGRIHFLGWRGDLDRLYADLDLAVLCSRNEGSPVSLIEAMAAGCPVVATRVGGVPDLVADGVSGLLVPPDAPEALAAAVLALLRAPERRRTLGAAGRDRVVPAFAAERLLGDIDRLYTDLLRERRVAAEP